ncbi:unnamed protein product [Sphenostylis stenocarpa]|uniref:Uncharacterized protein n=1 Tax=Sphenostylis stenocarpa TaxID=92480 RepID=A0AA86T0G5_9FABA|nr:unnamed protein product [Sphenostylis stenocarpa]
MKRFFFYKRFSSFAKREREGGIEGSSSERKIENRKDLYRKRRKKERECAFRRHGIVIRHERIPFGGAERCGGRSRVEYLAYSVKRAYYSGELQIEGSWDSET